LFPQPFEEIRIQADSDGLLCRRNDHARLFPKLRIGRPRLRVALDGTPDLTAAQRTEAIPIGALLNRMFTSAAK
jgi:hypothetical protein